MISANRKQILRSDVHERPQGVARDGGPDKRNDVRHDGNSPQVPLHRIRRHQLRERPASSGGFKLVSGLLFIITTKSKYFVEQLN